MKHHIVWLLSALITSIACLSANAQTITFTWNGSTDLSQLVELATIDGQNVNQATGYGGVIQIINGEYLRTLGLPQSLLPGGGGSLQCSDAPIAWGAKQWGTRPDKTTMDGTQVGDFYDWPGTATCTLSSDGSAVPVTVVPFHEFLYKKVCLNRGCTVYKFELRDTYLEGSGTATVE